MRNILLLFIVLLIPVFSFAEERTPIKIEQPWARPTIGTMKTSAAYMTIINNGNVDDVLTGISTIITDHAEMHNTIMRDGVASMIMVDKLSIPAKEQVSFAPGSLHIMLMGIEKPLLKGESFPLTLHFEKAGDISVQVAVDDNSAKKTDN